MSDMSPPGARLPLGTGPQVNHFSRSLVALSQSLLFGQTGPQGQHANLGSERHYHICVPHTATNQGRICPLAQHWRE